MSHYEGLRDQENIQHLRGSAKLYEDRAARSRDAAKLEATQLHRAHGSALRCKPVGRLLRGVEDPTS